MFQLKRDRLKSLWKQLDLPNKPPNTLKDLGRGISDFARANCDCFELELID